MHACFSQDGIRVLIGPEAHNSQRSWAPIVRQTNKKYKKEAFLYNNITGSSDKINHTLGKKNITK